MADECKDCIYIKTVAGKIEDIEAEQLAQWRKIDANHAEINELKTQSAVNSTQYSQIIKDIVGISIAIEKLTIKLEQLNDKPDEFKTMAWEVARDLIKLALMGGIVLVASKGML